MLGRVESFEFADIDKQKAAELERGGATVIVDSCRKNGDIYEVNMRVAFDKASQRPRVASRLDLQQRVLPDRSEEEPHRQQRRRGDAAGRQRGGALVQVRPGREGHAGRPHVHLPHGRGDHPRAGRV